MNYPAETLYTIATDTNGQFIPHFSVSDPSKLSIIKRGGDQLPEWVHDSNDTLRASSLQLKSYYKQIPNSESNILDFAKYKKIKIIYKFNRLKNQWIEDTKLHSSLSIIYNHPAYIEIIKMGKDAMPLILHDLVDNDNFWFKALQDITGVNLTTEENQGKFQSLKKDWINWAHKNNKIQSKIYV